MDRDQLIARLLETFLEEIEDHVTTINLHLIALEKLPPEMPEYPERLRALFRSFHSLKGAARSVGVAPVEKACHALEEILAAVRNGSRSLDRQLFALLFEAADALADTGRSLSDSESMENGLIGRLLRRLAAESTQPLPAVPETVKLPEPPVTASDNLPSLEAPTNGNLSEPQDMPSKESGSSNQPVSFDPPVAQATPTERTSLRVSADKLDRLLAHSSELLTLYRRTESWRENLESLQDFLSAWQSQWRIADKPLKAFLSELDPWASQPQTSPSSNLQARGSASKSFSPDLLALLPQQTQKVLSESTVNIQHLSRHLDRVVTSVKADARALSEAADQIDDEIRNLRMRPFSEVGLGLSRAVRDLALASGKEIDFVIEGGDVELDRAILEHLRDPLLHLLRNAVRHGIEEPGEREKHGKAWPARITIAAALKGAHVEILVSDDGAGIDRDSVLKKARECGFPEPQNDQELADLIFLPGFSTSNVVSEIAGRGVGLDVVASELAQLQGSATVSSNALSGSCFALTVPLTLTKLKALFVSAADQVFAFASTSVEKLLRVAPEEILSVEGQDVLSLDRRLIPIVPLSETLGLPCCPRAAQAKLSIVVVAQGACRLALVVDELLREQEVVVTTLGERLKRVKNISGATILPDGNIALILNTGEILGNRADGRQTRKSLRPVESSITKKRRLIVADDSLTTRILESSILEAAGYEVATALDGADAWELLKNQGADLLVSDVEMPRMDGFTLTETVRGSKDWKELPVILVTGLGKDHERARGLKVGASAYLVKSDFDQTELLDTIAQLL